MRGRRGTINGRRSRTARVGLEEEVTGSLILLGKSHPAWAVGTGHRLGPSRSGARKSRDALHGRDAKEQQGLPCSFTREGHLSNCWGPRVTTRDRFLGKALDRDVRERESEEAPTVAHPLAGHWASEVEQEEAGFQDGGKLVPGRAAGQPRRGNKEA